ncbi:MAG: spiro-SPASM protein [Spirochaetota bacterium]
MINTINLSSYAFEKVKEGKNAFECAMSFARRLPGVERIVIAGTEKPRPEKQNDTTLIVRDKWHFKDLLMVMEQEARGMENIFYIYGDCPLLDLALASRMYENHKRYFAEYTFADGYPYGLSPEILSIRLLPPLRKLAEESQIPITRESIFTIIQKDINAFDIETEISPVDLRLYRVSLTCDNKRNYQQTKAIVGAGGKDEKSVIDILISRRELLRTLPAYASIQIIDGCLQACSYCPFPRLGGRILEQRNTMPEELFNLILDKLNEFSDDIIVSVSLWGEPSLHPEISNLVNSVLRLNSFSLIIETSGVGWDERTLGKIASHTAGLPNGNSRLDWIISLDSGDPELYTRLRGAGLADALKTIDTLLPMFPGKVHIQAVRMKSNEENLEGFYRHWKKLTDNVIIQKYDNFCGFLPQEKVTDLSPLKRFPCWHIKRDLTILLDGRVIMCREDLKNEYIIGNILTEPLPEIWNRGEKYYLQQLREQYNPLCEKCDEYYTYNF